MNRLSSNGSEDRSATGRYGMVGRSPQMKNVYEAIEAVAATSINVLIVGLTGTGKELAAKAIFENSNYRNAFVAVNCSAIPESLAESEFFGHERGAFTGAIAARTGRIEYAKHGTLFLDEIDKMAPAVQPKFLRALQDRHITPVGSNRTVQVDFRLLAATNEDISAKVASKEFREDLYYRVSVFQIELPPLREREGDIDLLAWHFIEKYNRAFGLDVSGLSKDAKRLLSDYHWPGNVRELEGRINSAMVWKKHDKVKRPNGHAEYWLDRDDLERVWRSCAGPLEAEPVRDLIVEDFSSDIVEPYKKHAITKAQVEYVIRTGLEYVGGSYAELVRYFKLPESDYKRFMDFIRRHHVEADFRPYRKKGR